MLALYSPNVVQPRLCSSIMQAS